MRPLRVFTGDWPRPSPTAALELAEAGADVAICDVGAAAMPSVGYVLGGALDDVALEIESYGVKA